MRHSLRLRVFLMMVGVLAVALGALVWFASRSTSAEFTRVVAAGTAERDERVRDVLTVYYRQEGSWQGVQPMLEQLGRVAGARLLVTEPGGHLIADSSGATPAVLPPLPGPGQRIEVRGQAVAELHVAMAGEPPVIDAREPVTRPLAALAALPAAPASAPVGDGLLWISAAPGPDFLSSVNRSLVWAALLAGLAALGLSLALSRRILRPVEALTAAARSMEAGDLSIRVPVASRDELGTLAHAFNAMAGGLERQEALRRTMVSDISHELRTPLSNIVGYLEALREGLLPPSEAVLGSMHEEAELLRRLVDDLQELALAEAGQLRLARCPTNLGGLVAGALQALSPAAAERGVSLAAAVEPGLPAADVDPERIAQVLRNLLANALTHSPPGGRVTVAVGTGPMPGTLLVRVRDTGPGIPAAHRPQVFERFYRVDESRARATGGAGLGLAIVRQLVRAHGGEVWADEAPGGGAELAFTVPAVAAPPGAGYSGGRTSSAGS